MGSYLLKALFITFLILGVISPSISAAPPAQDPRPSNGRGGGGSSSGSGSSQNSDGDSSKDDKPAEIRCASLLGQTLSWGVGPISRAVELKTGSWQLATISSSDGSYNFGGLGLGVATLRLPLAPGEEGQFQPLVQEAGVYLNCDYPIVANLALFSGPRVDPPAFIEMSGPERLAPGQDIPIRLTVKNELPTEISNVVVTDLMPEGLIAQDVVAVSVEPENLKIIDAGADGQLVVAFLEKIAAGDEVNIFVTITTAEGITTGAQIRNTATLFYRESAADQDWVDFTIGEGGVPALEPEEVPAVATPALDGAPSLDGAPAAEAFSAPAPTLEPETLPPAALPSTITPTETITPESPGTVGEEFIPPEKMPGTGGDFLLPPDILPVTGHQEAPIFGALSNIGLIPVALLIGLGLGGLLSVFRHWRASPQDTD